jgi:hypothetical protein
VTRVDLLPRYEQENQVIVGIPARPISVLVSQNEEMNCESLPSSHFLIRSILIRTIAFLFTLGTRHLTILPLWIFAFGSIVCLLYSPKEDSSPLSCFSVTLMNDFKMFLDPFIGGTQWLNIFLNALGANIHSTALIGDIDCIDDPELITIDSYVYINQRARIQVILSLKYYLFRLIMNIWGTYQWTSSVVYASSINYQSILIGKDHHRNIIDLLFDSNLPLLIILSS